jgi:hypothetical protein
MERDTLADRRALRNRRLSGMAMSILYRAGRASYTPRPMEPNEKPTLKEKTRKILIIVVLIGSLLPPLAANIGLAARSLKWSGPILQLDRPYPAFSALMLCQLWTLFSSISPFNYTLHCQVQLTDGQVGDVVDLQREAAGKWESILFHNEPKVWLNLYNDRNAMRQYMEYLIRTNGLYPEWVTRRTIFLRYRAVLHRSEAEAAGTYFGPETFGVLEDY